MMRLWPVLLLACALAGCERQMADMYQQPRYDHGEGSPLFANGRADRPPPPGSLPAAAGDLAGTSSGRHGRSIPPQAPAQWQAAGVAATPPPVTRELLLRGQERYGIYCMVCHGPVGDGDGPVVRRGFPQPPSYHQQRLRDAPDRYFVEVMTQGHGVMYSYADRVAPQDRWAIAAYIRVLQLSQHAPLAQLPPALRERFAAAPAPAAPAPAGGASSPAGGPR